MYLMKENREIFASVLKLKNKNVTIFQTQADNEKTFVFVVVKKMNNLIKKEIKANQYNKFIFRKFVISFN